jgi:5-methylcytosine-specific restriction protein A
MQHTNDGKDNAYSNPAWRTIRRIQLSKQPLCQSCLTKGMVNSAKHIDHVFPWRQIGEQAFLHNIFQSLCHECHSYKTGQERKGIIIQYTGKQEKILSIEDYGYTMTRWQKGEII